MLTSHDVVNKKFERAGFGGYRNEDVDNFLNEVARNFGELEEQNSVLTKKLELLAEKLEEYRNDEESLRAALLGAQKLGDSIIRESKNKSEIMLRDATIKAERIINTAKDQVEKEKLVYLKIQKDVASFKNKLMAIYRQHIEIINGLPGDPAEREALAQEQQAAAKRQEEQAREQAEQYATPHGQDETAEMEQEMEAAPAHRQQEQTDEQAFEEPSTRQRKFIPIPSREEMVPAPAAKSASKFDEYYEDDETQENQQPHLRKSKFGTLKFGAGYDLKRE